MLEESQEAKPSTEHYMNGSKPQNENAKHIKYRVVSMRKNQSHPRISVIKGYKILINLHNEVKWKQFCNEGGNLFDVHTASRAPIFENEGIQPHKNKDVANVREL